MSKSITSSTVGGTIAEPSRSLLLLKAWMLSRVREHPGWLDCSDSRQRLFVEEADQLFGEVRRMQPQSDGLICNLSGSEMLRNWAPDVVARLAKQ